MRENKTFLINYTPIFGILLIFLLLLIIENDYYYIIFAFFYAWISVWSFYRITYALVFVSFVLGLFIDSIYNLSLGSFSFMMLTNIYIINIQSKLIKNNDFIKSITFFSINTFALLLFLQLVSFVIPVNFPSGILFLIQSCILFPIIFLAVHLYVNLFDNPHE